MNDNLIINNVLRNKSLHFLIENTLWESHKFILNQEIINHLLTNNIVNNKIKIMILSFIILNPKT
jgi:hypothetical protein